MKVAILLLVTVVKLAEPQHVLRTLAVSQNDAATSSMGAEAISALTKDVKTVFSLEDIAKILPHRYPFLLVDKVVEYEEGKVSHL